MNEEEIISRLRTFLGLGTNTYQDELIKEYMEETINDMIDSGVLEEVARSSLAVGNVFRGVIDKWDYNTGADYSKMWVKRTNQLRNITLEELEERTVRKDALREYKQTIYSSIENQETVSIPNTLFYNSVTDVLNVYINGNRLIEGTQYTHTNDTITFINPLEQINTLIEIINLKQVKYEENQNGNV